MTSQSDGSSITEVQWGFFERYLVEYIFKVETEMRQIPILMYHWFSAGNTDLQSRSPQLEISPELFDRQMKYLKSRGYVTVSLFEMLRNRNNPGFPSKPIVITFDDGTLDFWEYGKPVLEKYGFTATLFIVSGYVGGESSWDTDIGEPPRQLMSWEQLASLQESGYEICSHTRTHPTLTELNADEVMTEFKTSKETIEEKLNMEPRFIAYPRGRYDNSHKQLAQDAGYDGACAVVLSWRDLWHADKYEMKRITVKGTESLFRFILRVQTAKLIRWKAS